MTVFSEQLAQYPNAAWIIDPTRNRVLAANAPGCALFGWSTDSRMPPLVMDASMPGFVRLRFLLTVDDLATPSCEELLLWTKNGAERISCEISRWNAETSHLLLVKHQIESDESTDLTMALQPSTAPASHRTHPQTSHDNVVEDQAPDTRRKPKLAVDNETPTKKTSKKKRPSKKAPAQKKTTAGLKTKAAATSAKSSASSAKPKTITSQRTKQSQTEKPARQKTLSQPFDTLISPAKRDAETLEAIARQIRSGQRSTLPSPPAGPKTSVPDPEGVFISPATSSLKDHETVLRSMVPTNDAPQSASGMVCEKSLAKLAHEMKTTLSAIAAAAEIMRDERLGELQNVRYKSYASDIHDNAQHVLNVIENMLPKSKHHETNEKVSIKEFDLNTLVTRISSNLQTLADERELMMLIDTDNQLPHIVADITSVRQIIVNLVTNSLKFTPPGGRITITTYHDPKNGSVSVSVGDTGPGMEHAAVQRALAGLDPHVLSERDGGGFGLGFPLVQQLAEENGGRLSIRSRLGRGTTVTVTFGHDRAVPV